MNSPADFSIVHSITSAGFISQFVLIVLLLSSVASWAIILYKIITMQKVNRENRSFLAIFLKSNNFQELKGKAITLDNKGPIAALFRNIVEKMNVNDSLSTAQLERILESSIQDEMDHYEKHIHLLATIGNTAPFVGLFGTVVGIVNSFRAIGMLEVANIAVVAPGISEALIATAAGLAAAIPSVVAYNLFVNQLGRVRIKLEIFSSEVITLIETKPSSVPNA